MKENNVHDASYVAEVENEEEGFINAKLLLSLFLQNFRWFVLSLVICVGLAVLFVKYKNKVYTVEAKMLIKEDNSKSKKSAVASMDMMSLMSGGGLSNGLDNEIEVITSVSLSEEVIRTLHLYTDYYLVGTFKKKPIYDEVPVKVSLDKESLDEITGPVTVRVKYSNNGTVSVKGKYTTKKKEKHEFAEEGKLPLKVKTGVGRMQVTVAADPFYFTEWTDKGCDVIAVVNNPHQVAKAYVKNTTVEPLSKQTSIAEITRKDVLPQRSIDFIKELTVAYNRLCNENKFESARRTDKVINDRLQVIGKELGSSDEQIENFRSQNGFIDPQLNGELVLTGTDQADKSLEDINEQLLLVKEIQKFLQKPENKYQTLPTNAGLQGDAATTLISQYNSLALERSRLLRTASESNPQVEALTTQMDNLIGSLNRAIQQLYRTHEISRNTINTRYAKYNTKLAKGPRQERVLTEVGRQQAVSSQLYIMLLQQREQNNISLAANTDVGKLIDNPEELPDAQPKAAIVLLIGIILGLLLPMGVLIVIELLRHRIEGRNDLEQLTKQPVLVDIPIAAADSLEKGDLVVKENRNGMMEEVFRSLRTNVQFSLKDNQKVILFTSSTSGEGKTFVAANLAMSFALLGKKVLLMGADIRRPRLSSLFGLEHFDSGLTTLLTKESPTREQIVAEALPSNVNGNFFIMPAGPVPPNPAELLCRNSLQVIFDQLREEFDYIIIDSAPVGLVTDTLQLGKVADMTVVVYRADYTEKSAVSAIDELETEGKLPSVNIVLNGVDLTNMKYGKYSKYGSYGYGNYGM